MKLLLSCKVMLPTMLLISDLSNATDFEKYIKAHYPAAKIEMTASTAYAARFIAEHPEENFADKWIEHPKRQDNFYKWLEKVRKDLSLILQLRGMHVIAESMMPRFGRQAVSQGFDSLAEKARSLRESGTMKMAAGSGILGSAGSVSAKAHHFFGNHE